MCIKVLITKDQEIFIAISYFLPKEFRYNMVVEARLVDKGVPHGPSRYEPLLDGIS